MNLPSQRGAPAAHRARMLGAATLALALGACAQTGDDVKPTATTAYHSTQPGTAQPATAAPAAAPSARE